ncbi:MAG: hypothetical protein JWR18_2078 [Segetibacter sp.]|jgi:hypothetical protein|nr:hypothetical protein [Segetibacter sp.]
MKKAIIGALVGAVLVFGWQAVSHMFMHHHDAAYKQVADQENAIQSLSTMFKEDGQYLVPRSNPNSSQEEMAKFDEGRHGKPFAIVTYHAADNSNMGMSAIRSFTTAFLSVLIFILLLGKNPGRFSTIFIKSLGIAIFVFLYVYYNSNIWLQTPWEVIRPELIDLLAAWGLAGLWLGWWLNKGRERR